MILTQSYKLARGRDNAQTKRIVALIGVYSFLRIGVVGWLAVRILQSQPARST